jgi:hypothetical protein
VFEISEFWLKPSALTATKLPTFANSQPGNPAEKLMANLVHGWMIQVLGPATIFPPLWCFLQRWAKHWHFRLAYKTRFVINRRLDFSLSYPRLTHR